MADVPDPFGVDIALTAGGDVVVWPNGAVGTITGPPNAVQALQMRMRTRPGELTLHPDYGSNFGQIIGKKYDLQIIQAEGKNEIGRVIDQDPRFLAGQDVIAEAIDGQATGARVGATLVLTTGERITVSDIAEPDIVGAVAVPDDDLESLSALSDFDEFIAQDNEEADDLRDAAQLDDLVTTFDPQTAGD